jgi:DNA repair ATPase RecN
MKDQLQNAADFNRLGFEFLSTEIETGCTFARTALQADEDGDGRRRNVGNAKRALQTVHDLKKKLKLTPQQLQRLQVKLQELKAVLQQLGEPT